MTALNEVGLQKQTLGGCLQEFTKLVSLNSCNRSFQSCRVLATEAQSPLAIIILDLRTTREAGCLIQAQQSTHSLHSAMF